MLLGRSGYTGCKTGITEAAGPCCSVTYQKDGNCYAIILLNSISMKERWIEVPNLVDWVVNRPSLMINGSNETLFGCRTPII